MDLKEANKDGLTVTDVMNFLAHQLEQKHDVKLGKKDLKNVFVEALLRSIVMDEVEEMMLFIADEDKQVALMEARYANA